MSMCDGYCFSIRLGFVVVVDVVADGSGGGGSGCGGGGGCIRRCV